MRALQPPSGPSPVPLASHQCMAATNETPEPGAAIVDTGQMEATALRAARAARERWSVPAQDMDLAQVR